MKTSATRHAASASACALILACGAPASAQYFQRHFGTRLAETPRGLIQADNEDLATTGFADAENGIPTTYVSRHRADGSLLWSYLYHERQGNAATGWAMLETFNNELVVAGHTTELGPLMTLSLMRLNALGGVIWAAAYDNTSFEAADVFTGIRRNVAVEELFDIGFVAVTSDNHQIFPGHTQARMLAVHADGTPMFQKVYITSITNIPNGISFNDLRIQQSPLATEIVVTGTLELRPPGANVSTYEALYARFDLAGNPIAAFSYSFQPAAGGPVFDIYGDGIQTLPGSGDVIIMGRTNMFSGGGPAGADAAVLRITPGGIPAWARAVTGVGPSAAAMSRSPAREIATAGYTGQPLPAIGSIALLCFDEAGNFRFSRRFSPPSGGFDSLGRDQVWCNAARPGWCIAGDETDPHTIGARDLHLTRTDTVARVGCFEEGDVPHILEPVVQIRQLSLLQSLRELWSYRPLEQQDPRWEDKLICQSACPCPGDANGDSVVDFNDVNAAVGAWGALYAPGTGPGDANCDGVVDFNDINFIVGAWNTVCP